MFNQECFPGLPGLTDINYYQVHLFIVFGYSTHSRLILIVDYEISLNGHLYN